MDPLDEKDPMQWPPGTVRIDNLLHSTDKEIILQPRPSDDPNDPLNWKRWEKYLNFFLVNFYAMMVFALIDAATPTWGPMNVQLGFSYEILNDSYAIGCGTLAFGAFILIPFALKYGRRPIYIISTAAQFAISIWSAKLQTVADLLLINALSCLVGALAEVLVQMTVADVFFVHERGMMNSIYIWSSNIGGSLAPVAAGYITVSQGWRWTWWWCAIFFGIAFVAYIFLYEETKFSNPVIEGLAADDLRDPLAEIERRHSVSSGKEIDTKVIARSRTQQSATDEDVRKLSVININPSIPRRTYRQKLALYSHSEGSFRELIVHSYQPFLILFTIPAVFYMSMVYGVMLAWSTIMITTLSSWMTLPPYNFNASQIGLMTVAPFIGTTIGSAVCGPLSDRIILRLARRNNGIYEPEMRLWVMAPFIPFVPAGAFMFGIGLNNGDPWPLLAVGYALCSFGTAPIASIALTYITDSYTEIVGDALVGVTFTRNVFATIFVFALTPWIDAVGMLYVYVTIGVLGAAVLLFTFVFIKYGKRFRIWTAPRYRFYASRQFEARKV